MSNSFELGKIIGKVMLFPIIFFILISTGIELLAQNYEFTLNQRRRFNQIHVEIWAKSLNTTATKIGNASLVLQYNTRYLSPASTQSPSLTDSISYDINQVNPVVSIISPYNQAVNGFNTLGYQSYSTGYYSLEINLATLGVGGYRPGTTGRGTFVGKLAFDIQGNPDDNALTGITWSKSILPGDIRVFDIESNDIESQVNFIDPSGFKVTGITILSPNVEGLVIDRDKSYLSLSGFYADGGYPIYFERSINPDNYKKPSGPPNVVPVDENLGYALSYSLDNGVNWNEFGRVVETERDATQTGNLNTHRSGQIFNPSVANSFIITNQNGAQLNYSNYGDPLRIIWEKDLFVSERSEQARIRITKLAGTITTPIATRAKNTLFDVNDAKFIYGRLFFMQLSGNGQYFVTENNFSNSTQLTVEAWINLNEYQSEGSEPAIVVSSGGPNAEAILGSKEGAWMLYLKDGRYPAFRVREIQGRGDGGYLGSIVSYTNDMITVASDAEPLDNTHAENWMHISATVNNNVVSLYVNGELVDRVSNNIATDIRMLTTSHPVWIGVNPNYSIESQDYIRAGLKEVKIWRTALTQDEIRARVAGVPDPSNTNIYGDLRRGLQLYYSFEGNINDLASNATYQNGNDAVSFVNNGVKDNSAIKYRPDRPHLRLTAPVAGAGVSNIIGNIFNVRWISYGIGDISKSNTNDVALEYSLDNGTSWKYIKNDADKDLGGATAPDVETGTTKWDPGRNNSANANLSSISPYSKNVILRIRGHDNNRQSELMNTSGLFSVAPYFAAKITKGSIIVINGNEGMNISGNSIFLESWIRPYRFPTDEEGFFPIICKRDSTTPRSHYELRLLPTGRIQFRLTDINGNVRIANSDAELPLVMPNSVTTDSAWTHVGVYFYKNNGVGSSEVRFYIDGNVQRADTITTQLGDAINLEILNKYPTYIGYYPSVTMPDTVPGIQTSNITITGNLNSGSLTGTRIPVTRTIYDKAGDTHDYTITFIKDAVNNEFSYIHSIGSKDIWSQTENVIFQGNISATATGASENFSLNLIDWTSGNSHPINLSFNKTANANEFNLVISFNGNNLYQYLTTFNSNGTLASPQTITVAAADLNTALGSVVFDQTTPRNIVIKLTDPANPTAGLMYTPGQTTTANVWSPNQYNLIKFNTDGSINMPLSITLKAADLNNVYGANIFDAASPKDINIKFADAGNLLAGLTQMPSPSNVTISNQDGTPKSINSTGAVLDPSRNFIGEIRQIRFWNGSPNNSLTTGTEPTNLSLFVQGVQSVQSSKLTAANSINLNLGFSFNGGSYIQNGWNRAIGASLSSGIIARMYGSQVVFVPVEPYIKLVEPKFKDKVANTQEDVRVRWVGFEYDPTGFNTGQPLPIPATPPSLEFSIRGGGGKIIQPYQYVASDYWAALQTDAMSFPNNTKYQFMGTGSAVNVAAQLNASIADPDTKDDGSFVQGPIAASLTNFRLRLTGKYTVNSQTANIVTEGPLFTITPASNFTIRALLEGYHKGGKDKDSITNLASSYSDGGLRIKLYSDNSGSLGSLVDSAESLQGYDNRDPGNRNKGNFRFSNVNFVFTELIDGFYWVLVEHPNHMPIMSRYAASFQYVGDTRSTWLVESGWDFSSWNGEDNNILSSVSADPWTTQNFTAYGSAIGTKTLPDYSITGLNYNDGLQSTKVNPMPAMVAGDVELDGQINAADRVRVRLDEGTGLIRSDVTGDGVVNANDRTIVDRNYGKVSSLYNKTFPSITNTGDAKPIFANKNSVKNPFEVISDLNPEMSQKFINNAKIALSKENIVHPEKSKDMTLASDYQYDVWAEPNVHDDYVDLDMYIQNKGKEFSLANCTFAISYNSVSLDFASLQGADQVLFNNVPERGYAGLQSAPAPNAIKPLPDVRSIEIDYDAFANLGGKSVPDTKTYLGTLRFNMKARNGSIMFKWNWSSSVHTTDGLIITNKGNFKPIEPIILYSLSLITPNGGEDFTAGDKVEIKWNSNGSAQIYLEYSLNNGKDWVRIDSLPITADRNTIEWNTPNVSSSQCLVRIIDAASGKEMARSNDIFSLLSIFSQIIRPSSGDQLYRSGTTTQITWFSTGYKSIFFELSTDSCKTWSKILKTLDAALQQSSWAVPQITTKAAFLRMIDNSTQKEIARSGQFKILSGSVDFKYPKYQEQYYSDKTSKVRWASAGLAKFDLEYSIDGGMNWTSLKKSVTATTGYFDWLVPDANTDIAVIRALWNSDPDMEYNRTDIFKIKNLNSYDENLPEGFKFGNAAPNPFSENSTIDFTIPEPRHIRISLLNVLGETIMELQNEELPQGNHRVEISSHNLASGAYYVRFSSDGINIIRELRIVK